MPFALSPFSVSSLQTGEMALTFAAQDAKESEDLKESEGQWARQYRDRMQDMLRSALAAETTSLILVQSEAMALTRASGRTGKRFQVERSEAAMC